MQAQQSITYFEQKYVGLQQVSVDLFVEVYPAGQLIYVKHIVDVEVRRRQRISDRSVEGVVFVERVYRRVERDFLNYSFALRKGFWFFFFFNYTLCYKNDIF